MWALGNLRDRENRLTFHDLRPTFGSMAVPEFPLSDVTVMMGHADIQTTMIYIHYVPQYDAADILPRRS
jgi:integrase